MGQDMSSSTLYLYGSIAEGLGAVHKFAVDSLADCIVMLGAQHSKAKLKHLFSQHDFELIRNGKGFDKDDVRLNLKVENEFHLMPLALGADKGTFNIIAGIALIAVAFFIPPAGALGYGILTAGTVGMLGFGMVLTGIGMIMAPSMDSSYSQRNDVDKRPSYVFNGPINSTAQGSTIPLVCGEFICGSIVIASELQNEDI